MKIYLMHTLIIAITSSIKNNLSYNYYKANFNALNYRLSFTDWSPLLVCNNVKELSDNFYNLLFEAFDDSIPHRRTKSKISRKYPPWFTVEMIKNIKEKVKAWKLFKKTNCDVAYDKFKESRKFIKEKTKDLENKYKLKLEKDIMHNPGGIWRFTGRYNKKKIVISSLAYDNKIIIDPQSIACCFAQTFSSIYLQHRANGTQSNSPGDNPARTVHDVDDDNNVDISINRSNNKKSSNNNIEGGIDTEDINNDTRIAQEHSTHFDDNYINELLAISNEVIEYPTIDNVNKNIKKLKNKVSCGIDGIPSNILKKCYNVLNYPLYILIRKILETGVFPKNLKLSKVVPVYKDKGDRASASSYRPVTVLSPPAKVVEACLFDLIIENVRDKIAKWQHGFVPQRSTNTNIMTLLNYVYPSVAEGYQVDVIYTDFSKAFDLVDFGLLIDRLVDIGIPIYLIRVIKSYLADRDNYVTVEGSRSQCFKPTSGVPQGSNLGPLLFIIFVNNFDKNLKSPLLMYADDAKIYAKIRDINDAEILQQSLDAFVLNCTTSGLKINKEKCKICTYSRRRIIVEYNYKIGNVILERVRSCLDLGITFDNMLNFSLHVENVVRSATRVLGFIFRICKGFSTVNPLILLYTAFVRSKLEFGVLVWAPDYQNKIKKIERIHTRLNKYLNYIEKGEYLDKDKVDLMKNNDEYVSLDIRRKCIAVIFCIKLIKGAIDATELRHALPELVGNLPRRNRTFYSPMVKTNFEKTAPIYRLTSNVNWFITTTKIPIDNLLRYENLSVKQLVSLIHASK